MADFPAESFTALPLFVEAEVASPTAETFQTLACAPVPPVPPAPAGIELVPGIASECEC